LDEHYGEGSDFDVPGLTYKLFGIGVGLNCKIETLELVDAASGADKNKVPACLPSCLSTCLPVRLPACLHTCLLSLLC